MDWKTKFHTKEEFDRVEEEGRKQKQWGRWVLDENCYPSLDIQPYPSRNNHVYQIRLFDYGCDFPTFLAWLGRWVQHLQLKSWMSYKDLWDFVDAAQTIHMYRKVKP